MLTILGDFPLTSSGDSRSRSRYEAQVLVARKSPELCGVGGILASGDVQRSLARAAIRIGTPSTERQTKNRLAKGCCIFWPAVSVSVLGTIKRRFGRSLRRAKDSDGNSGAGLGEGFNKWVQQKKAEGAGGAGGAVLGGMIAGPLGAFLGAQIGSRVGSMMPNLEEALEQMDKTTGDTDSVAALDGAANEATSRGMQDGLAGQAELASARRAKAAQEAFDKASVILHAITNKCDVLKADIEGLYSEAQDALSAGDESKARSMLARRAEASALLEKTLLLQSEAIKLCTNHEQALRAVSPDGLPTNSSIVEECSPCAAPDLTRSSGGDRTGAANAQASSPVVDELASLKKNAEARRTSIEAPTVSADKSASDLAALKQGLHAKVANLEAEAVELYARAEDALRASDEARARDLLAARADVMARLDALRGS